MHSLPPSVLRCGVAFMFLCELVGPWLLLAPITPVRRVGVVLQIPLQLGIALTGVSRFERTRICRHHCTHVVTAAHRIIIGSTCTHSCSSVLTQRIQPFTSNPSHENARRFFFSPACPRSFCALSARLGMRLIAIWRGRCRVGRDESRRSYVSDARSAKLAARPGIHMGELLAGFAGVHHGRAREHRRPPVCGAHSLPHFRRPRSSGWRRSDVVAPRAYHKQRAGR